MSLFPALEMGKLGTLLPDVPLNNKTETLLRLLCDEPSHTASRNRRSVPEVHSTAMLCSNKTSPRLCDPRVYMQLWEKKREEKYLKQAFEWLEKALRVNKEVGDHDGEARTLHALGLLSLLQQRDDVAFASFLLAHQIAEEVQSSLSGETEEEIQALRKRIGEDAYKSLRESVEPQADRIVAQVLNAIT